MRDLCLAPFRTCCRATSTAPEPVQDERASVHSDSSSDEVINLQGDQFDNKQKEEAASLNLGSLDMMALGLTGAIGGHYFAWNSSLTVGFGGFLIALFFVSTGYYCLVLCISELSSALPFAGGAYGIARVTLGVYPGFLVAVCDTYKSIIYSASAAYAVGEMITFATGYDEKYEYGWWVAYYVVLMGIHCYGGRFFWRVNIGLAAISTAILFVYIFGTIKYADFQENAPLQNEGVDSKWFFGGLYQFVHVYPRASRFFVGIQSINLACGQLKNPKRDVPRGSLGAITFCMFTSFAVLFLGVSLPPGLDAFIQRARPLTQGFQIMFALPRNRATLINLPATVMSGSAFMYYYGQQISAMGRSGMLSALFGKELPGRQTPVVGLFVGTVIGFGLCVIELNIPDAKEAIYDISILAATTTYLSIFASYIVFRTHFPSITREFESPFGVYGAVYGFAVFSLSFVSMCGFQKTQTAIVVFGIIIVASSIYYYLIVAKRQVFSDEEKKVMFKAYLLKNNAAKADRVKRGVRRAEALVRQSVSLTPSSTNQVSRNGGGLDPNFGKPSGSGECRSNTVRMPYMLSTSSGASSEEKADHDRHMSPVHDHPAAVPMRGAGGGDGAGDSGDIELGAGAREREPDAAESDPPAAGESRTNPTEGENFANAVAGRLVAINNADIETGGDTPPPVYNL